MSEFQICRLCVNPCTEYRSLYGENGQTNVLYEIIKNYFHPMILNIKQHKHLNVICVQCRDNICDFHNFQNSILLAQAQLGDEDKDKLCVEVKMESDDLGESRDSLSTSGENGEGNGFKGFPQFKITDVRSEGVLQENRNVYEKVSFHLPEDIKPLQSYENLIECTKEKDFFQDVYVSTDAKGDDYDDGKNKENRSILNTKKDHIPLLLPKLENESDDDAFLMVEEMMTTSPFIPKPKSVFEDTLFGLRTELYPDMAQSMEINTHEIEKSTKGNSLLSTEKIFTKIDNDISILDDTKYVVPKLSPFTSVPMPMVYNSYFDRITKEFDEFIALYLPTIKCVCCPLLYPKLSLLYEHFIQNHPHDQFHFKCCHNKLDWQWLVEDHILQHLDPNTFKCDLCVKCYQSRFFLDCHMKRVHGDCVANKYKCEPCGRGFATVQGRQQHYTSVHVILSHYFPHYAGHNVDYTVHTCEECDEVLVGCLTLNEHIWNRHPIKVLPKGKIIIYACTYCPKTFKCMLTIFQHWKDEHPLERTGRFFQEFQMLE